MRTSALKLGVWSTLLQLSRVGINALVFILISRILAIEEIGIFSTAFAILQIFIIFVRSGVTETVVSVKDKSAEFLDTAFGVSILFGVGSFLAMNVVSALTLFWSPDFFIYVSALSIILLVDSVGVVPDAILRGRLELRALAMRTFIATSISAVIALSVAYAGFGAWSLVGFSFVTSVIGTGIALGMSGWHPRSLGQRALFSSIAGPALRVISSSFASATIVPAAQLLVGIFAGPAAAGAYAIAQRLLGLAANFVIEPARYLALPFLANLKDTASQSRAVLSAAGFISAVASPLYLTLFFTASDVLPLLVGANGTLAIPVFSALAWHFPPLIVSMLIGQRLTAERRMQDVLIFTGSQAALNVIISLPLALISATAVAIGYTARAYLLLPLVLYQGHRHAGLPWRELLLRTLLPVLPAFLATLAGYLVSQQLAFPESPLGHIGAIAVQVVIAAPLYLGLLRLVSRQHFELVTGTLLSALKKKKPAASEP